MRSAIIRTTKGRMMRWAEDVARVGEMRNGYKIFGKPKRKGPFSKSRNSRRIILKWVLGKMVGGRGLDSYGSG
jgi:hypothetical protein